MIEIIPNWHPILVHFTVALFSLSVLFFLGVSVLKEGPLRKQWTTVAYWNLWIGALITIGTLIAGWLAYNSVAHDTPSHTQMTTHRNWAFITAGGFLLLFLWSLIERKKSKPGILFVLLGVVSMAGLGGTAWHGGEAVYRFGLGVMSLPKSSGKGHSHSHAKGEGHGDTKGHGDTNSKSKTSPVNKDSKEGESSGHSHGSPEKNPSTKESKEGEQSGHSHGSPEKTSSTKESKEGEQSGHSHGSPEKTSSTKESKEGEQSGHSHGTPTGTSDVSTAKKPASTEDTSHSHNDDGHSH